jgi:hypothetical protein
VTWNDPAPEAVPTSTLVDPRRPVPPAHQAMRPPSAALFFSGPHGRTDGIDTTLRGWGWTVHMVDTVNGPGNQLCDAATLARWADRISANEFDVVGLSPDCASFSRLRRPRVRDGATSEMLPDDELPATMGDETGPEYASRQRALRLHTQVANR